MSRTELLISCPKSTPSYEGRLGRILWYGGLENEINGQKVLNSMPEWLGKIKKSERSLGRK